MLPIWRLFIRASVVMANQSSSSGSQRGEDSLGAPKGPVSQHRESASWGSGGRMALPPERWPGAGLRQKVRARRNASGHGADLAYSKSVALPAGRGTWGHPHRPRPAHRRATAVHLEGTHTIADSTSAPRRRPALDREGPSTVVRTLRSPDVPAPVCLHRITGQREAGAHHQVPDETSPL